nr:capsid scaffold protein [Mastomys natalensis cytomegalovirus 3]WEG69907.1 capsid scaffold protein [Mastomys natalensis cytomegalovirus 3]WEG70047.1 capsid scaffold protein [Mastomys natalensis cytomegalovirus 3]WEG70187.1 capsid scaffold protein [Mastomys natalensis cytomegalovirus 3]WEG70327.1 capsid scaffold protein [Mastomys natalensis cytomegalovirus 3]
MTQVPHGIPAGVTGVATTTGSSMPSDCVYLSREALVSILSAASRNSLVPTANPYPPVIMQDSDPHRGKHFDHTPYPSDYGHSHRGYLTYPAHYPVRERRVPYDSQWSRYDYVDDPYYERSRLSRGHRDYRYRRRSPSPEDAEYDDGGMDYDVGGIKRARARRSVDITGNTGGNRKKFRGSDDDLKLPGERGYPQTCVDNKTTDDIGEVKATLNEIRRDISQMRASSKNERTIVRGEDSGNGGVGSSDQKCLGDVANTTNIENKRQDSSGVSRCELVNASCEPVSMDVDASDKKAVGAGVVAKSDILEMNRRVFVSLLNNMD